MFCIKIVSYITQREIKKIKLIQDTLWETCLWTDPNGIQYSVMTDGSVEIVGGGEDGEVDYDGDGTDQNTCVLHTSNLEVGSISYMG